MLKRNAIDTTAPPLEVGEVSANPGTLEVSVQGDLKVRLTPTQHLTMQTLMRRPGYIMSRDQIMDVLYGNEIHVDPRTVDSHIKRIRRALVKVGLHGVIETVHEVGYRINPKACYLREHPKGAKP